MIDNNFSGAGGVSAYVTSLLAKTGRNADGTSNANTSTASTAGASNNMQAAAAAALKTAAQSFKSTTGQQALATREAALGAELKTALAKAGVTLEGPVEFTVASDGALVVAGSEKDETQLAAFLKSDTSKPSLSSRLVGLANDADALSGTIRQSAAISQAARYAGSPGGVMALYASLMQQQEATSAVFAFSSAGSSLSYPGVLASTA